MEWRLDVRWGGGNLVVEGAGGCGAGVEAWWRWGGGGGSGAVVGEEGGRVGKAMGVGD